MRVSLAEQGHGVNDFYLNSFVPVYVYHAAKNTKDVHHFEAASPIMLNIPTGTYEYTRTQ